MQSISSAISKPLTDQEGAKNQHPLKKIDTSDNKPDTISGVEKKVSPSRNHPPVSPAAILNISSTSVLVSLDGNLYRSNVSWNKTV